MVRVFIVFLLSYFQTFALTKSYESEFVVHYMWGLWDSTPLPSKFRETQILNNKKLDSSSITHYKDEIFKLVKQFSEEYDPKFYELFVNIPRKVCQADLGRYILIYYLGGIYCDLDVIIKKPKFLIENRDSKNGVWLTEFFVTPDLLGPREKPYYRRIAQYFFYVKQKHNPLLLEIIFEAFKRVKVLFDECRYDWSDIDILWATGPDVVTTILHESLLGEIKVLSYENSRKLLLHRGIGSWRDDQDLVTHQTPKLEKKKLFF